MDVIKRAVSGVFVISLDSIMNYTLEHGGKAGCDLALRDSTKLVGTRIVENLMAFEAID